MKCSISLKTTILVMLVIVLNLFKSYSQTQEKRSIFVKKIDQNVILDGILDEAPWDQAEIATDFWQIFPTDSLRSSNETIVKLLYDDTHIYIGAFAKGIGCDSALIPWLAKCSNQSRRLPWLCCNLWRLIVGN